MLDKPVPFSDPTEFRKRNTDKNNDIAAFFSRHPNVSVFDQSTGPQHTLYGTAPFIVMVSTPLCSRCRIAQHVFNTLEIEPFTVVANTKQDNVAQTLYYQKLQHYYSFTEAPTFFAFNFGEDNNITIMWSGFKDAVQHDIAQLFDTAISSYLHNNRAEFLSFVGLPSNYSEPVNEKHLIKLMRHKTSTLVPKIS